MAIRNIAVVGAGIGGLSAALALARRGFEVQVYERATSLGEIGAGIHMSPNGNKVLNALGLREVLAAVAARPLAISTRDYATGIPNFEGPLDSAFEARFGAPFYSFHRADLHSALATALQPLSSVAIKLNARAMRVVEDSSGVELYFENGSRARADVVIAADGVHSRIRSQLHGELDVRFTGHVAYRGMAETDTLPPGLVEPKLNIWVGPFKHFVAYPVRRGELINYVAIVEEGGWSDESWTAKADKAVLTRAFEGWHATVRTLIDRTLSGQCYKWALLGRDALPRWSSARVTLLGDAAHPMVPYVAQGAVMAVEDAWVLAACLATAETASAGLVAYEDARRDRTSAMQAAAWEQGQLNHAVGREAQSDQFNGGRFADPEWIYRYDAVALYPA